ncbi:MAG: hypothetical protein KJ749_09760 [Planctomycetes bacterium]|nr:hypothetical protein [Planctomycetota bacterium]
MRERFQLPIPMWRAQCQLLGGHRRMLLMCLIYTMVLSAAAVGFYELMRVTNEEYPVSGSTIVSWMLHALGVIQILIVVLAGCAAIHRATLRDYETKMIESHRLTPMSNTSVVLGYLFGANVQILALFLINLAFGAILSGLGQSPAAEWLSGNLLVLAAAVTLWSMVLLSGMRLAKPLNPLAILVGIPAFASYGLVVLPAAGFLLCALPVVVGYQVMTGRIILDSLPIAALLGINVFLTVFWLSAAAAKYRRPDLPALNAFRGLMLLMFWLVLGTGGIALAGSDAARGVLLDDEDLILGQWVATMILSLLAAIPAIAGAVQCQTLIRSGSSVRDWADRAPPVAVAVLAAGLICSVMAGIGVQVWRNVLPESSDIAASNVVNGMSWLYSGLACLLAMLTAWVVCVAAFAKLSKPLIASVTVLLILWSAPPLVDSVRGQIVAIDDAYGPMIFSWLLGASPAGTIFAAWTDTNIAFWPGLLVQAGFLFLLSAVAIRVARPRASAE